MSEETSRLRTLDFFMGLAFTGIGSYVVLDGMKILREPSLATFETVSNPGMTSIIIGGFLALLGIILTMVGFVNAKNPLGISVQVVKEMLHRDSFWRGVIVVAIIAIYFFVLWRLIPYWISTLLFISTLMFIFKAGPWWKILLIAGATTGFVVYFFGVLAQVPLP